MTVTSITSKNYTNPVKRWRLNEHITQADLAWDLNVTRQVITNLESGLYLSLPIAVIHYTGITQNEYQHWIHYQRGNNARYFNNTRNVIVDRGWLAFKWSVRPDRSDRGFCRLLLFQPSVLRLYELHGMCKGKLRSALLDVGMPSTAISSVVL